MELKSKRIFSKSQVADAVEEIVKLRLVENWTGCLKLETDGKKIYISQFASSNSWTHGYETIYEIAEYQDWSDFGEFDEELMKLSRIERWNEVDRSIMLEYQTEQAEEKMEEYVEDEEKGYSERFEKNEEKE